MSFWIKKLEEESNLKASYVNSLLQRTKTTAPWLNPPCPRVYNNYCQMKHIRDQTKIFINLLGWFCLTAF